MSSDSERPSSAQAKRRKIAKAILSGSKEVSVLAEAHNLTMKQAGYVEGVAIGLSPIAAARVAGYAEPEKTLDKIVRNPNINVALEAERAKNALFLGFSRRDVLEGISEAIEQAKLTADPMAQIAGWREVAKICGYYAPEVKKVELTHSHKRKLSELEQLSDEELLEMTLKPALEAEFSVVEPQNSAQTPSETRN